MPADRLLHALIRNLQTHTDRQDTATLLSTAATLLTTLSNPRNLTVLTAQLLTAPALWTQPAGLRTCVRIVGAFQSAAQAIVRHELDVAEDPDKAPPRPGEPVIGGDMSRNEWVEAVLSGADDRSPRWRHLLVIAGLLVGYEGQERQALSSSLRDTVGIALVKAANLSLEECLADPADELAPRAVTLALNYSFELLSGVERSLFDYDRLLPILVGSALFSPEGYRSGYFLAHVDGDVVQAQGKKFTWSERSQSFLRLADISSQPLIAAMGPLSRLIAHTVENLKDAFLIQTMMDDLSNFTSTLFSQWRLSKLSEVDIHDESVYFDETALTQTLPVLWRTLRSALFATTVVLRAVVGRILRDRSLSSDDIAPTIAIQSLHILRHLYFISSRLGPQAFTQHTFVYLAALDILFNYPFHVSTFAYSIRPATLGTIPSHPLERNLDLFFLNTAEHFTLVLSPEENETLLIGAAAPYLAAGRNNNLLEIFEAAHSVMLAVFSVTANAELTARHLPFYVDALFRVFPQNLSARQFRLAFKTLLKITAPPSSLASTQPDLSETLMELLYHRAVSSPDTVMNTGMRPAPYTVPGGEAAMPPRDPIEQSEQGKDGQDMDEKTTLLMALVDCLPFLPLHLLEEWLPLVAQAINMAPVSNQAARRCRERMWDCLSGGEMDVERASVCVAWWGTKGGREMVLGLDGWHHDETAMSGALNSLQGDESKL